MAWLFTTRSYTSSVRHKRKPNKLMVRGRDKPSLEAFCKLAGVPERKIYVDFPSDYPYRVIVTQDQHDAAYLAVSRGIGYTNFKSQAARDRGGDYVSLLHKIWSASHMLTDNWANNKNDDAWDKRDRKNRVGKYAPKPSGRWSVGGAWAGSRTPVAPPLPEQKTGYTLGEVLEMTPDEREEALADLEAAAGNGNLEAEDLLDEIDKVLPEMWEEGDELDTLPLQDMTEQQWIDWNLRSAGI